MLDGPLTELGPCACATETVTRTSKLTKAALPNALQNWRRSVRFPNTASPQYVLSPVFSGVPGSSRYASAQTRPSVVVLQVAGGLAFRTSMHLFLTSKRTVLC